MTKHITIGGMKMQLTPERKRRIAEAIADTQRQIDREMGYSEDMRKQDLIDGWKRHIGNLQGMLA